MTAGPRPALPAAPFLYAILDASLLRGRPPFEVARALAEGGSRLVQVRAKGLADRALVPLVREVMAACRPEGVPVVVNDRPDVARITGADGLHLGQRDVEPGDARRVVGDRVIVGVSTHGEAELARALGEPVDYLAVGPVFETDTKPDHEPVVGTALVRRAAASARRAGLPLVAIGGITRKNAADVIAAGADGVAVISDLLAAGDPASSARAIVAALGRARS